MSNDYSQAKELERKLKSMSLDDRKAYFLIHELGHTHHVQAVPAIERYLDSPEFGLRQIALNVLVHHWGLKDYGPACEKFLIADPHPDVRSMAALCLGTMYSQIPNKRILKLLALKLKDRKEEWTVRQTAYESILRILNYPLTEMPPSTREINFDTDVNWKLINSL
jgi:hypothetical protein